MTKRVAVIEFSNESNTFTVLPTRLEDFKAGHFVVGDEIPRELRNTNTEVAGFIDAAEQFDWQAIYTVAAQAEPGGIVTESARAHITELALSALAESGELDGLLIVLHGAMVTESCQDGESQFLSHIRALVGEQIPIAVTLDLHANVFDQMVELVDIAVSFRTYPHVDMYQRGLEACQLLEQAMSGQIEPAIALARPAMLVGCDDGRTTDNGPMCRLLESAQQQMQQPGILNVAINAGFTDADVYAAGPSVLVSFDRRQATANQAQTIAESVCDEIWQYRHQWALPEPLDKTISRVMDHTATGRPLVIADFSDNPGSGAYSDCTALLKALLATGIDNVAIGALYDPEAVAQLKAHGIGKPITLQIGGKTDPSVGGGPLELSGEVSAISDGLFSFEGPMFTGLESKLGDCVNFKCQGVEILIVSERTQMLDKNIFRCVAIEPSEKAIVAVKSMQHFRAAFAPIAEQVLVTDAGGLCSPDVAKRNYQKLRRPVFPLDMQA